MSRHLPPNPSLEHLRKQAKDLLRELQQREPEAQLADAQHLIAKQYGFASWPKLKAHVEALPARANPLVGAWKANLSRSTRHPSNPFRSATLEFRVAGDTVTIADVVVDQAGREERSEHTVHADGIERVQGNGYTLVARWRNSRVLETMATKNGQVVGWGRYEVSADDGALTVSGDEQTIVLERT